MKLNPTQVLVRAHYEGGEFLHVSTKPDLKKCGDGLFVFLMDEAGDADTVEDFRGMLDTAIKQLRSLKGELS